MPGKILFRAEIALKTAVLLTPLAPPALYLRHFCTIIPRVAGEGPALPSWAWAGVSARFDALRKLDADQILGRARINSHSPAGKFALRRKHFLRGSASERADLRLRLRHRLPQFRQAPEIGRASCRERGKA